MDQIYYPGNFALFTLRKLYCWLYFILYILVCWTLTFIEFYLFLTYLLFSSFPQFDWEGCCLLSMSLWIVFINIQKYYWKCVLILVIFVSWYPFKYLLICGSQYVCFLYSILAYLTFFSDLHVHVITHWRTIFWS